MWMYFSFTKEANLIWQVDVVLLPILIKVRLIGNGVCRGWWRAGRYCNTLVLPLCCILNVCISSMEGQQAARCLYSREMLSQKLATRRIKLSQKPAQCWYDGLPVGNPSSLTGLNHQVSKNLRSTFTVSSCSQLREDSSITIWPILKWIFGRWSHPVCVYSH